MIVVPIAIVVIVVLAGKEATSWKGVAVPYGASRDNYDVDDRRWGWALLASLVLAASDGIQGALDWRRRSTSHRENFLDGACWRWPPRRVRGSSRSSEP